MVFDHDSDVELIRSCRAAEPGAFEALLARYQKPVFNAALRMLRNPEDARDATQMTFLKVFQHLADFNPNFKLYSWIYRIALNESINIHSRRREFAAITGDEPDDRMGAEDMVASEQAGLRVQAALMTLKTDYRAVIVLKHFLGCSYDDMAGILELPVKTVKSRLFTARQLLREALERAGDDLL